jgi:hypothetical protein
MGGIKCPKNLRGMLGIVFKLWGGLKRVENEMREEPTKK